MCQNPLTLTEPPRVRQKVWQIEQKLCKIASEQRYKGRHEIPTSAVAMTMATATTMMTMKTAAVG